MDNQKNVKDMLHMTETEINECVLYAVHKLLDQYVKDGRFEIGYFFEMIVDRETDSRLQIKAYTPDLASLLDTSKATSAIDTDKESGVMNG